MNTLTKLADDSLGKVPVVEGSTQPNTSSTETMRAITWQGKKKTTCEQVPKPILTHSKDVIVKVTACTICSGSDGHIFAGEIPGLDKGYVIGHECCGIVEQKGSDVHKLNVGDRVVVAFDIACGECDFCKREEYTGCDMTNDSKLAEEMYGHRPASIFGYGRLLGNVPGSQAEYVRVPYGDVNCYLIPDDVPDEKALYLSDVLCTSLHACRMGEVKEGSTVAIWGLGPIGLCAARWAQILGARKVIGIDLIRERLTLAQETLNIDVIDRTNMKSKEVIDQILKMVPGGVDTAIEAAGFRFPLSMMHKAERAVSLETDTPEIIEECVTAVRKFGHVSIIGDYVGYANNFPIGKIMFNHLTVRSGQCPCQKYFDFVMKHVQDGIMDPTFMITNRIALEEVPMAYKKLQDKADGWIKVFVQL